MPRRALGKRVEVPVHLLLQGDEGTAQEQRLRRYARWRLSPYLLTKVEAYARQLAREGKTAADILEAIARFDTDAGATGVRLSGREQRQVASIRHQRKSDPEHACRTLWRWLRKGHLRDRPPKPDVPLWVDRIRCEACQHDMGVLRKLLTQRDVRGREQEWATSLWLLPSGETYNGYCRTCKRRRRFVTTESVRVDGAARTRILKAYEAVSPPGRSGMLLKWLDTKRVRRTPTKRKA